jgi:hypothetical protein
MLITIRTSPVRRKSSSVRNSSRPSVVVPLRFSARITPQPAARNADSSSDRKRDQTAKFNCEKSHSL